MSVHSYSRCWLHLIWATQNRERMLFGEAARKASNFLSKYAESKGIYMRVNYVNPEHVHALIDLPTGYSIEDVFKLLKGASSHWINQNRLFEGSFSGGEVTESSQFHNPMLTQWGDTSLLRRHITERGPFWKNMKTWSGDTAYSGSNKKPLKRLVARCRRH